MIFSLQHLVSWKTSGFHSSMAGVLDLIFGISLSFISIVIYFLSGMKHDILSSNIYKMERN